MGEQGINILQGAAYIVLIVSYMSKDTDYFLGEKCPRFIRSPIRCIMSIFNYGYAYLQVPEKNKYLKWIGGTVCFVALFLLMEKFLLFVLGDPIGSCAIYDTDCDTRGCRGLAIGEFSDCSYGHLSFIMVLIVLTRMYSAKQYLSHLGRFRAHCSRNQSEGVN